MFDVAPSSRDTSMIHTRLCCSFPRRYINKGQQVMRTLIKCTCNMMLPLLRKYIIYTIVDMINTIHNHIYLQVSLCIYNLIVALSQPRSNQWSVTDGPREMARGVSYPLRNAFPRMLRMMWTTDKCHANEYCCMYTCRHSGESYK